MTPTEEDLRLAEAFIKSAIDHMGMQRKGQKFLAEDLAAFRAEARRDVAGMRAALAVAFERGEQSEREACERIVEEKLAELRTMTPEDQDVRGQLDAEIGLCFDILEEVRERAK